MNQHKFKEGEKAYVIVEVTVRGMVPYEIGDDCMYGCSPPTPDRLIDDYQLMTEDERLAASSAVMQARKTNRATP